ALRRPAGRRDAGPPRPAPAESCRGSRRGFPAAGASNVRFGRAVSKTVYLYSLSPGWQRLDDQWRRAASDSNKAWFCPDSGSSTAMVWSLFLYDTSAASQPCSTGDRFFWLRIALTMISRAITTIAPLLPRKCQLNQPSP